MCVYMRVVCVRVVKEAAAVVSDDYQCVDLSVKSAGLYS